MVASHVGNVKSAESLAKQSRSMREKHAANPERWENHRRKVRSPEFREARRLYALNMSKFPKGQTRIEAYAQESLVRRSIQFFPQRVISNICRPDVVLSDHKVAIFCDGCYWHGCPLHSKLKYNLPNGKAISSAKTKDVFQRTALENMGWEIIQAWEHEFEADQDVVGKKVEQYLSNMARKETEVTTAP